MERSNSNLPLITLEKVKKLEMMMLHTFLYQITQASFLVS